MTTVTVDAPEVELGIEPPGFDDDDPLEPYISVFTSIIEPDETRRIASATLPPDADDETIADVLVRSAIGAAMTRSPTLYEAVLVRMRSV